MRIEAIIGRGAMGEVFRATQLSLKRQVAVKRIADHLLEAPEAVARFEREAQTLAKIHSPYVVAVHDYGRMRDDQGQDHYLLVMELVEGARTLRSCIDQRLAWPQATALVLQAARGLAAAAEFGVVHRDVKPHNIIVSSRGIAKLADFGLARACDSTDLTSQGMVLGTPAYMAPEACRSEPVDGRSDLYSLGVTWFQLLSGRTPFLADNTPSMLHAHVHDQPPRIEQLVPGLPARIAELVNQLLEKDQAQRPASAVVLVERILRLQRDGIELPETVVLPGSDGLSQDPTTAATRIPAELPRTATLTALLIAAVGDGSTVPTGQGELASTVATAPRSAPATPSPPAPPTPPAPPPTPPTPPEPMVPAPVTTVATAAAGTPAARAAGRAWWLVGVVAVLAGGGVGAAAWWQLRPTPQRAVAGIAQAVEAGNLALALADMDEAVRRFPGDAGVLAAGQDIIRAEVDRALAHDGPDAARTLLARRVAALTWLDDAPLQARIDCEEADRAVAETTDRKRKEAAYEPVYKRHPEDPQVLTHVLQALPDDGLCDYVAEAAVHLAELSDQPPAIDHMILQRTQRSWGAGGPLMARIRTQLLRHWPADCLAIAKTDVLDAYDDRREAAFLLLEQGHALTPEEAVGYHVRNLLEFDSGSEQGKAAVDFLTQACAAPDWPALRGRSSIPVFTTVASLESSAHEAWPAMRALLEHAFPVPLAAAVPGWIQDTEHHLLRWNAFLIAQETHLPAAQQAFAFHAQTLATFDVEGPEEDAEAAFAYFGSLVGSADAARAEVVVRSTVERVTALLARYREVPGLRLHVRFVVQTLKATQDLLDRFTPPPAHAP